MIRRFKVFHLLKSKQLSIKIIINKIPIKKKTNNQIRRNTKLLPLIKRTNIHLTMKKRRNLINNNNNCNKSTSKSMIVKVTNKKSLMRNILMMNMMRKKLLDKLLKKLTLSLRFHLHLMLKEANKNS